MPASYTIRDDGSIQLADAASGNPMGEPNRHADHPKHDAPDCRVLGRGNGTAGRETESFVREALKEAGVTDVPVVMVNESGASIYSASETAREGFRIDLTWIRRDLDRATTAGPWPNSLKSIRRASVSANISTMCLDGPEKGLDFVVDSCVNSVGVNLNTASITCWNTSQGSDRRWREKDRRTPEQVWIV